MDRKSNLDPRKSVGKSSQPETIVTLTNVLFCWISVGMVKSAIVVYSNIQSWQQRQHSCSNSKKAIMTVGSKKEHGRKTLDETYCESSSLG